MKEKSHRVARRCRVFDLAGGYADCNDAARLADDPVHKLVVGRDPLDGRALVSQPTLSRFENATGWVELRDMAHELADIAIEHRRRRRKRSSQWATRCAGRSSPTWRRPGRRRLGGPPCPTRRVGDGWGRERSGG
jgi:hypothetical protein